MKCANPTCNNDGVMKCGGCGNVSYCDKVSIILINICINYYNINKFLDMSSISLEIRA